MTVTQVLNFSILVKYLQFLRILSALMQKIFLNNGNIIEIIFYENFKYISFQTLLTS